MLIVRTCLLPAHLSTREEEGIQDGLKMAQFKRDESRKDRTTIKYSSKPDEHLFAAQQGLSFVRGDVIGLTLHYVGLVGDPKLRSVH